MKSNNTFFTLCKSYMTKDGYKLLPPSAAFTLGCSGASYLSVLFAMKALQDDDDLTMIIAAIAGVGGMIFSLMLSIACIAGFATCHNADERLEQTTPSV